uniref:HEAT repeat domain-containing protein n=1 Tax=Strongyloides venezuelensis TaxID=75913 RepID=A0A0K0FLI2_STRVS
MCEKKDHDNLKLSVKNQPKSKFFTDGSKKLLEVIPSADKFKEALSKLDSSKRKTILESLKEYKTSTTLSYLDLFKKLIPLIKQNESTIILGIALYIKEEDKVKFLIECVKSGIIGNEATH